MTVALRQVMPAIAARLGSPTDQDVIGLPQTARYVVVLIDGLGWSALDQHASIAPFLARHMTEPWQAEFPTTTPVGLAALGTGLPVGEHGLMGASFWVPECDAVLAPLHWPTTCSPTVVQPEPTVFERLAEQSIAASSIGAFAYAETGLTEAVLRGSTYRAAEDVAAIAAAVANVTTPLSYVYWAALDRIGHRYGVSSPKWCDELVRVNELVEAVVRAAPDATVIVTADHGMVNIDEEHRFPIDRDDVLRQNVRRIAGEPRMRHIYLREPTDPRTAQVWREYLADRATVLTRDEALPHFSPLAPGIEERIGDLVCIAHEDWMLTSEVDRRVSALIGQHGALTDDEVLIPGIVITT